MKTLPLIVVLMLCCGCTQEERSDRYNEGYRDGIIQGTCDVLSKTVDKDLEECKEQLLRKMPKI